MAGRPGHPPFAARDRRPGRVRGRGDRHRHPTGGSRAAHLGLHVLLQWDDEGNDRQLALDLFDAFGSEERTLHANMGGHTGVPQFEEDDGNRFFARHLK
jgi:hypothetical protein